MTEDNSKFSAAETRFDVQKACAILQGLARLPNDPAGFDFLEIQSAGGPVLRLEVDQRNYANDWKRTRQSTVLQG